MYKKITTVFASAILLCILSVSASTARAAIITQELLYKENGTTEFIPIGQVTISTLDLDPVFSEATQWLSFDLFGFDMITEQQADDAGDPLLFGEFFAEADPTDPWAGLSAISFDVSDHPAADFAYQGIIDPFLGDMFLNIFDRSNNQITDFGMLDFGRVSVVSEPHVMLLMFASLGLLRLRRKQ